MFNLAPFKTVYLFIPGVHNHFRFYHTNVSLPCHLLSVLTFQSAVKVGVGGHLEARVRQQEAVDVGEAGVDVLPHVLQLLMLVLLHLSPADQSHWIKPERNVFDTG